jgi:hypothetical protein
MAIIRAICLKDARATALSTTLTQVCSTGAFELGPLEATQRLSGFFHLTQQFCSTDRMLVVSLQSATSSGFATPVTHITFGLSTEIGSTMPAPVAVSTEHAFFRAAWNETTLGAITTGGAWKGLVGMGIS